MGKISSDREMKSAMDAMAPADRRRAAAKLVESVLYLSQDERVARAVATAMESPEDAAALERANKEARSASVESYTQCGVEAEWLCQAGHFVAEASAVLTQPAAGDDDLSRVTWKAALSARMARTSELIGKGESEAHNEAERQYEIIGELVV